MQQTFHGKTTPLILYSLSTRCTILYYDLDLALREIERWKKHKYICVESYRNEEEKAIFFVAGDPRPLTHLKNGIGGSSKLITMVITLLSTLNRAVTITMITLVDSNASYEQHKLLGL